MLRHYQTLAKWPMVISLLTGAAITAALLFITWTQVDKRGNEEFQLESNAIRAIVTQKLNAVDEGINNLVTLFNSSLHVDSDQFRLYAGELLERQGQVKAIYYTPLINRNERDKFEDTMDEEGFVDFEIHSSIDSGRIAAPLHRRYLPITYIEPFEPTTIRLLGFDFSSNSKFDTSINQAIDSGDAVASRPGDTFDKAQDYLLFKALYAGKQVPQTVDDRRGTFNGMVVMRIAIQDLLQGVPHFDQVEVNIVVPIAREIKTPNATWSTGKELDPPANTANVGYQNTVPLDIGGHTLNLVISKPISWKGDESLTVMLSGLGGLAITGLLFAVSWIGALRSRELMMKHQEVQKLVYERTQELDHEKQVLETEIESRKLAEAKMAKLSRALEDADDSVFITDCEGVIEYVNPSFERVTGYSWDEVVGKKANILNSGKHDAQFYENLWLTIKSGKTYRNTIINKRKNHDIYYEEKSISSLKNDDGTIINFVSTGKDVSDRVEAQERLEFLAHHDVLTGLANRAMFSEQVEHAIKLAKRRENHCVVIFIDLDRFKCINDTLGHDVGDQIIKRAAERLTSCVRKSDLVARLGGDEFTVLLEDVKQPDAVKPIADKMLARLSKPIEINGHELFVTASIGIALYPEHGEERALLMKRADTAMYHAKENGKNNYQIYQNKMNAEDIERLTMEATLRRVLDRGEYVLHYQPQFDTQSKRIVGMEALLRWDHPDKGLVAPADFIPILEETGMIIDVGRWVIRNACQQNKIWQDAGFGPFRIAVNLSGRQFRHPNLVSDIREALEESDLKPHWLELEITETVMMENAGVSAKTIAQVGAMGVRLSIDDFGTGYSSLSYLKKFPIDFLKVDRSFVKDITTGPDSATIVQTIVTMGHSLRLEVIAEGVETEEQLEFLRACDCDVIQGFLFSRPLDAKGILALLNKERSGNQQGESASITPLPRNRN